MSKVVDFPTDQNTLEVAAGWLVLMDDHVLSVSEEKEFKEWLDQSRQHVSAIEEVAQIWGKMDVLSGMSELFPLHNEEEGVGIGQSSPGKARLKWLPTAVAAALVGVAVYITGSSDLPGSKEVFYPEKQVYVTEVGETEEIALQDGSTVTANTNSELIVEFDSEERRVFLAHGEAFFKVEHDPTRPFLVHAGNGIVRAVGTAFSVYNHGDRVEVVVTEGAVEILSNEMKVKRNNDDVPLLLESGQVAEYDEVNANVEKIDAEMLSRKLLWKQGMLVFEGESLEEVIHQFSRYTKIKIEIVSDDIRDIRVGGYFYSNDLTGMLKALENNFGIHVAQIDPSHVRLSAQK